MFLYNVTVVTKERNIMKKLFLVITLFLLITATISNVAANGNTDSDGKIKIGLSKLLAHPALDQIEKGIKDYLAENGIDADIETQNANGDISTASSIAQVFKTEGKDLVVGIATPTAQALANTFSDIPVVFATVTDPEATGLEGLENVAGTSDMVPLAEHLRLMIETVNPKRIGMVYTSSEANGIELMEAMKEKCEEMGIELVTASVANSAEVMMAALSIVDRIDAMYVATDNTVVSAISSLSSVCMDNSVPLFSADTTSAFGSDVFLAGGFDYYKSGLLTGEVIKRMIDGENPKDIGTLYLEDLEIYVNLDVAEKLGIEIPSDIIERATYIIGNGTQIDF